MIVSSLNHRKYYGFARGIDLKKNNDLTPLVKKLPEYTVLCTPILVAGGEHVKATLIQSVESWERGIELARNRSIDILLRLTAMGQISEAIQLSKISNTDTLAVIGLLPGPGDAESTVNTILEYCPNAERNDMLLSLTEEKEKYLRRIHSISYAKIDLMLFLEEKSALLNLSK